MSEDEMISEEFIDRLAEAVAARVRPPFPLTVELWDTEAIARYLKRKYSTVRDHILCQPSFPKPVRLPGPVKESGKEKSRSHPLYKAREVIAWAESYQSKT